MEDEKLDRDEEKKEKETDAASRAVEAIAGILYGEKSENVPEKCLTAKKERQKKLLRAFRLILNNCRPVLEEKIADCFDVEDLVDIVVLAEKEHVSEEIEFLHDYCDLLLDLLDGFEHLRLKVMPEVEWVVKRLLANDKLENHIMERIWMTFKRNHITSASIIKDVLPLSKEFIEEVVFNWVVSIAESNESVKDLKDLEFYSTASSHCCLLFVMISKILNQFVICTDGNERVLELVEHYVQCVTEKCHEAGKSIFSFYPKHYFRLLSLLCIPPHVCSGLVLRGEKTVPFQDEILDLISVKFKENQTMTLLLLTHHPNWLSEFYNYVKGKGNMKTENLINSKININNIL